MYMDTFLIIRNMKRMYVTQYIKRYILSTFETIEILAWSNRRFNKLYNDTKFVKTEVILLKVQLLQSVYFLLFSLYFTHCFVHYLRINLADKMSLLMYKYSQIVPWVTLYIFPVLILLSKCIFQYNVSLPLTMT